MIVKIEHISYELFAQETGNFVHIANIRVSDDMTDEQALEYAWRHTNNINGSWSIGPVYDDLTPNDDYCEFVEVVAPLFVFEGRTMGFRSSMVGDRFSIDDRVYEVASLGFNRVRNA
jgi:hypothetical protein